MTGEAVCGRANLLSLEAHLATRRREPASFTPIIFIHNRKSGGSTVNRFLARNGYDEVILEHHTDELRINYSGWKISDHPTGNPDRDFRDAIDISARKPGCAGLYFDGHIGLGHRIFDEMPCPYVVLTVVRDPVEHMLSFFRFSRRMESGWASKSSDADVVDFARRRSGELAPGTGFQYRHYVGRGPGNVETALENMERQVAFFGFTDRMAEFLFYLGLMTPITTPTVDERTNVTDGIPLLSGDRGDGLAMAGDRIGAAAVDDLREILADDIRFFEGCRDIHRRKQEVLEKSAGLTGTEIRNRLEILRKAGKTAP